MKTTIIKRMCLWLLLLCAVTSLQAKTKVIADFKASDYDEIAKGATFSGLAFENGGTVTKDGDGHATIEGSSAVVDLGEACSLGSKTKVHVEFESTFPNGKNFQIQFFEQANNTWGDYKWSNKGNFYRFRNNPLDTSDKNGIGLDDFTYSGDRTWNSRIAWTFDFDMEKATVVSTATPYVDGVLSEDGKMAGERTMDMGDLRYFRIYVASSVSGFSFDCVKVTVETEGTNYIAYLYDSSVGDYSLDDDEQYFAITESMRLEGIEQEVKAIDTNGDISALTADSLSHLQAVVVGGSIGADNAIVPVLGKAVAMVPMLNSNAQLLGKWGWATMKETAADDMVTVTDTGVASGLFQYLEGNGGGNVYDADSSIVLFTDVPQAYELDSLGYLRNDRVLLKKGNLALVHQHNAGRNELITFPWMFGQAVDVNAYDVYGKMFLDVVGTKRVVVAGTAPSITLKYENEKTMVTLSGQDGVDAKIYYTLDGTEPTMESTLYSQPFEVTQADVTVKAVALSDGYALSPVAEKEVDVWSQSASPKIETVEQDGQTIVMLSSDNSDDVIAFTYRQGTTEAIYYETYTEPITLKHPKTITAIVKQRDGMLQSEAVSADITVNNEKKRTNVLAHFDAAPQHYAPGQALPFYYIGKTDLPVYTDEVLSTETFKDQSGEDSIVKHYAINTAAQYAFTNDTTGWRVGTGGVVITSEATQLQSSWGLQNATHYTPWDAQSDTEEITPCNFSTRAVSTKNVDGVKDPGTAYVQTVRAYPGPFDIVTFACGYNSPIEVYVSADTTKADGWKKIGEAATPNQKLRGYYTNWLRSEVSYDETTPVFVKLLCMSKSNNRIFDIYLYGEGELNGIESVKDTAQSGADIVRTEIYNMLGQKTDRMANGMNIIKYYYKNGTTESRKVVVK